MRRLQWSNLNNFCTTVIHFYIKQRIIPFTARLVKSSTWLFHPLKIMDGTEWMDYPHGRIAFPATVWVSFRSNRTIRRAKLGVEDTISEGLLGNLGMKGLKQAKAGNMDEMYLQLIICSFKSSTTKHFVHVNPIFYTTSKLA